MCRTASCQEQGQGYQHSRLHKGHAGRLRALECVRLAAATGASCVTAYDALSGLLSFEELRQKMEAGWEKQNIIHP